MDYASAPSPCTGIVDGRQVIVDIDARGAGKAGRRDVYGDEDGATLGVGHGGAIVEGGVFVAKASLHDLKTLRFERAADLRGELQDDFAFADAGGATCSGIGAAVGGVEHHGIEDVVLDVSGEIV